MLSLIDEETGEIKDYDAFEKLYIERDKKIENTLLWYKNETAEAEAIKKEIDVLKARKERCENIAKRLKSYASAALGGEKFRTSKVSVSYRKSSSVETDPEFIEWAEKNADEFLKYAPPEPNKTAIKNAINSGLDIKFAHIEEKNNILIK